MNKRRSLKRKLMGFVLVYIFALLLLMMVNALDTARAARRNSEAYFRSTMEQMKRVMEVSVSNTAFFAYTLSRNSAVQEIFASAPRVGYGQSRQVTEFMSQNGAYLYLNTGLINAVFLDEQYAPFYATFFSGDGVEVYRYLQDNEALRMSGGQGGVHPINRQVDSAIAPSFLYAIDVMDTRLSKDGNRRMGTIVFLCNLEKYRQDLAQLGGGRIAFAVTDGRNTLLNQPLPSGAAELTAESAIDNTPWRLRCQLAPSPYSLRQLFGGEWFTVSLAALALLAIPGVALLFHHYITRPIEALLRQIRALTPGRRLPGGRYREIQDLSSYVNAMLEKNERMTGNLVEGQVRIQQLETLKARTELSALQSQINPHFLYNTLECVRSIAQANRIESIQTIVSAMADLFRYSIKGEAVVKVRQEAYIIGEYCKIVSIRFSNRYTSFVDIQEDILDAPMLKMVLQPLVENAFFHGLEKRRTGQVRVTGRRRGGDIVFVVEDDGESFAPDTLQKVQAQLAGNAPPGGQDGIGLANIHRKIQLYYGEAYGLRIESQPGQGSRVEVVLPETGLPAMRHRGPAA